MKKILILSFIVTGITNLIYSQTGFYEVTFDGWAQGARNHHCGYAYVELRFNNTTYNYKALEFTYGENSPRVYFSASKEITKFLASKTLKSIYFSSSRRSKSSCSGRRPNNNGSEYSNNNFECYNFNFNFHQFDDYREHDSGLWNSQFNMKIYPKLTIIPNVSQSFPTENDITINSHTGFKSSEYNWQYSFDLSETNWKNMPQFSGSSSITLNAQEIDNSFDADTFHGRYIYFRQTACNFNSYPATYQIRRSAPNVKLKSVSKTKCYNSNDGSVTISFDRAIREDEKINYSLLNTSTGYPYNLPDGINIVSRADGVNYTLENDNTYTINNLPPGEYTFQITGDAPRYDDGVSWNLYNESSTHKITFTITEPSPVEFTATHTNVNCNEGSDGSITIRATGGTGNYKYVINEQAPLAFSNGSTHIETGLPNGSYTIKVLDSNDCIAQKISRDSNDNIIGSQGVLTETILITQPDEPVSVEFPLDGVQEPTAFGFSNGSITAKINGGTKFLDDSYSFTWKYFDSQTATWINWSTFNYDFDTTTKDWFIILKNAKAGDYKLTVTDANYTNATNTAGCTIIDAPFTLKQPPLLELEIIETKAISCNNTNTFGNPWSDGELTAIATGGLPFNPLINGEHAYRYIWKKKDSTGVYKVISGEISKVLSNIDVGDYAVNIIDANGITIGTSLNNVVTPVDVLTTIKQPDLLEVTLKKEDVSCVSGNDGSATVSITGGIPPYTIQWANGQNTATATGLTANNHVVYVTDARGCMATGNITIDQPNGIQIETLKKTLPTCYGGNDGSIELQITGGELPYTYSWSTGEATTSIQNLSEGIYTFKLTDANGCVAFKEIVLEDPNKIEIDLDADRTLCKNQYYNLDASIDDPHATYLWTSNNGFSSTNAQISVTEAGIYEVTATTALGCTATDSVIITTDDIEIDVEFLLSSQAYVEEDVILFNVSDPLGENSNWDIPKNVTIVNQTKTSITLRFPEANTYKIGLTSTQGSCYANQYKNIVVEDRIGLPSSGDAKNPFIEAFSLTPNPNTGQFQIVIHLAESSPIGIRIFDVHGGFVLEHLTQHTAKNYTIPMQVSLQAGVYFVVLETAKETQVKRMIAK